VTVSPLSDGELLLRRFDPTDSSSIVKDENDGVIGITGGALKWVEFNGEDKCCSTVRESVLIHHRLTKWAACDTRNTALASTSRAVIEEFEHTLPDGTGVHPFSAKEDPEEPATPLNLAHAVVHTRREDVEIGTKQLGKAKSALAKRAFTIVPPEASHANGEGAHLDMPDTSA
jgi:hypothetical protein